MYKHIDLVFRIICYYADISKIKSCHYSKSSHSMLLLLHEKEECLMKKVKAVAYFATKPGEEYFEFIHSIFDHCIEEKMRGYEEYELVSIFHDLNKEDSDELPAWEQLIEFLVVNKDIKRVLLPKSNDGLNFDGYDYLLDLQEFLDVPCASSWPMQRSDYDYSEEPFHWTPGAETSFLFAENESRDNGRSYNGPLLDISPGEIPF
jgi:hypothetical protein